MFILNSFQVEVNIKHNLLTHRCKMLNLTYFFTCAEYRNLIYFISLTLQTISAAKQTIALKIFLFFFSKLFRGRSVRITPFPCFQRDQKWNKLTQSSAYRQ